MDGSTERGEAHQFSLAPVDGETAVLRERAVEEADRVGVAQLPFNPQPVPMARAQRGGRPLADTVDREDSGGVEGGGVVGRSRVARMVLGVGDEGNPGVVSPEPSCNLSTDAQLSSHQMWRLSEEGREGGRSGRDA